LSFEQQPSTIDAGAQVMTWVKDTIAILVHANNTLLLATAALILSAFGWRFAGCERAQIGNGLIKPPSNSLLLAHLSNERSFSGLALFIVEHNGFISRPEKGHPSHSFEELAHFAKRVQTSDPGGQ